MIMLIYLNSSAVSVMSSPCSISSSAKCVGAENKADPKDSALYVLFDRSWLLAPRILSETKRCWRTISVSGPAISR